MYFWKCVRKECVGADQADAANAPIWQIPMIDVSSACQHRRALNTCLHFCSVAIELYCSLKFGHLVDKGQGEIVCPVHLHGAVG